jgi:Domain of unknown function (DUF3786)
MPRIDDYNQAFALVKEQLSGKSPDLLARVSGADMIRDIDGSVLFSLLFLNQGMRITWPDFKAFSGKTGEEMPIQQQILLLHYLHGAWSSNGAEPTGEWISFQEVPDGRFYLDAFHRRAKNPLVQAFGEYPERMAKLASQAFESQPFDRGDASVLVRALPRITVALILWKGDEEFPPEGNILFDRNIIEILSAEDIAWLAGMVVYPLIGMAKQKA